MSCHNCIGVDIAALRRELAEAKARGDEYFRSLTALSKEWHTACDELDRARDLLALTETQLKLAEQARDLAIAALTKAQQERDAEVPK